MATELTYYIFEGVLAGTTNGKIVNFFAGAGGGAGSTKNRPEWMANSVYAQGVTTQDHKVGRHVHHTHGGPLPAGTYTIGKPYTDSHLGLCAKLTGKNETNYGRTGGFFIHGRGKHGSDGCIVPLNNSDFQFLMKELTKSSGGTLHVLENMGNERFA